MSNVDMNFKVQYPTILVGLLFFCGIFSVLLKASEFPIENGLRITGGSNVSVTSKMHRSILRITYNSDWVFHGCSCTFVTPAKYLLTAAHCVRDALLPGTKWTLQGYGIDLHVTIKNTSINPQWGPWKPFDTFNRYHDIAVLELDKDYSKLGAIPLEMKSLRVPKDSPITVYGYGYTGVKYQLAKYLKQLDMIVTSDNDRVFDLIVATSSQGNTCAGDSGGGAFTKKNELFGIIWGGTSGSFIQCDGSGITEIVPFVWNMPWLQEIIPNIPNDE